MYLRALISQDLATILTLGFQALMLYKQAMTAYFSVSEQDVMKTCGDAPPLEVSRARLEEVWSNLV